MSFNKSQMQAHAMEIVKAALSSGAIKLNGPNSGDYNAGNIKSDVEYVNGLINGIVDNLLANSKKD